MADANATTMAIVAEIFAAFPGRFRFTSGRRTAAQNAAVNGHPNSFHLTGQAADFVAINGSYPKGEKEAIGRLVARYGYEVVFHNVGSGLHYHIEPAPGYLGVGRYPVPGQSDGQTPQPNEGPSSGMIYAIGFVLLYLVISE